MRTLSVLFVDDEKLERILLIKGYDWNGKGFEIVGDVSSGIEALELMRTMEPDIVFTDINMAQMDGLEFVSLAKERFKQYQTKYIIITGFRDFEYARQAVKLGVEEFLLKPINFDELDEILNKMRRQICEEQYEREHISTLKRSLAEKTDALKEILFLRLAEKTIVESDAMQQLSQLGCGDLLKKHICCLVLHRQTLFTTVDSELLAGNEQIAEILALWNCICMILHHSGDIIIYCAEPDEHKVLSQAKVFVSLVENTIGSPLYLGISFVQAGFESFYHGFKEAQRPRTLCSFSFNTVCIVSRDFETIINRIPDNQFDRDRIVLFCKEFVMQGILEQKKYVAIFVLPALLIFVCFAIIPLICTGVYSFFSYDGIGKMEFIGLNNYLELFTKDKYFPTALVNSLILAAASVFIQLPLSFILALVLARGVKGEKIFRTIYFVPVVISSMVIGQLWLKIFKSDYGLLNSFLRTVGIDDFEYSWLSDPQTAFICTVVPAVWQYIGYHMLINRRCFPFNYHFSDHYSAVIIGYQNLSYFCLDRCFPFI